jgi:hypothetical protein
MCGLFMVWEDSKAIVPKHAGLFVFCSMVHTDLADELSHACYQRLQTSCKISLQAKNFSRKEVEEGILQFKQIEGKKR